MPTKAQIEASRANGRKGGRPRNTGAPCSCGRTDGTHPFKCPRYWRWYRDRKNELAAEAAEPEISNHG